LTNVWGSTVNTDLTQFVENAIAGYQSQSVTGGDWTLSTAQPGDTSSPTSTNAARYAILIATGAPGVTRYIYAPKSSKTYVVINNCSDSSLVYIKGGPTSSTPGISIAAGSSALVAWDSTKVNPDTSVGDFVKVAGGGAGATGGGTDQIFYQNGLNVTTNYTITTNNNAGTFGPVTIDAGVTVTVPSNSVWTVV
jgi:hypothetical protein